ncbi:ISKra4 family transposase [Thiorhodococcus minor]|uniref:ISKra4 family transposase n=1 Tax=Thiorhodococcus minor TaxID=57489 RepID=A0A6M0K896_9GAMM|nr:ISKra4 family transposase [Thiorhodococcus minor]
MDARLQLPEQCTSYLLQDWNARLMQAMPYAQAEQFLENLLDLPQSVQTLERDQARLSTHTEAFWEQLPAPAVLPPEAILVDQVDGKGVYMRPNETGGERGKKKMAILGAVYGIEAHVRTPAQVLEALFAESRAAPSVSRPTPLDKHVRACLKRDEADTTAPQNEEIFAWIAQQNALRDPDQSHRTVVLSDGQTSFWEATATHLPGEQVTEILDLLHACGYVWDAAKLLHPSQPQAAQAAAKGNLERLLNGQVGAVIERLRRAATTLDDTPAETLERIVGYFETHRHRMAYDLYLAEGLPIATGVIEGACRCLVKDRMERAGMRWVVAGAQTMLALRGITISGLWEDFIAVHIREDLRQLYGPAAANADSYQRIAA